MDYKNGTIEGRKIFRDISFDCNDTVPSTSSDDVTISKFVRKFNSKTPLTQTSGSKRLLSSSRKAKTYKLNDTLVRVNQRSRSTSQLLEDKSKSDRKVRNTSAPNINNDQKRISLKDSSHHRNFVPISSNGSFSKWDQIAESWEKRRGGVSSFTNPSSQCINFKGLKEINSMLEKSDGVPPKPPPMPDHLPISETTVNQTSLEGSTIMQSSESDSDSSSSNQLCSIIYVSGNEQGSTKKSCNTKVKKSDKFTNLWLSSSSSNSSTLDSISSGKNKPNVTSFQGYRNMITRINHDRNNKTDNYEPKKYIDGMDYLNKDGTMTSSSSHPVASHLGASNNTCIKIYNNGGESDMEAFKESEVNYVEQFTCGGVMQEPNKITAKTANNNVVIIHRSMKVTGKDNSPMDTIINKKHLSSKSKDELRMTSHPQSKLNTIYRSPTIVEIKSPLLAKSDKTEEDNIKSELVPVDEDEIFAYAHEAARSSRSSSKVTSRCSSMKSHKNSKTSTLPLSKFCIDAVTKKTSPDEVSHLDNSAKVKRREYFQGNILLKADQTTKKLIKSKASGSEDEDINVDGIESNFTPYGYVSRPGSTPASYSLWSRTSSSMGSSISSRRHRRQFSKSLCRVVLCCTAFLVILAVVGIVGIAVYLGVIGKQTGVSEYFESYSGGMAIKRGDNWVQELAFKTSPAFRAKASKYKDMLSKVYSRSLLAAAVEDIGISKFSPVGSDEGFELDFRVILDRRKIPNHISDVEKAVRETLLQEFISVIPVAFSEADVDIDTFFVKKEKLIEKSLPIISDAEVNPALLFNVQEDSAENYRFIKAPGGAIIRVKRPLESVPPILIPNDEESTTVSSTAAPTTTAPTTSTTVMPSTVRNLHLMGGSWKPLIHPFLEPSGKIKKNSAAGLNLEKMLPPNKEEISKATDPIDRKDEVIESIRYYSNKENLQNEFQPTHPDDKNYYYSYDNTNYRNDNDYPEAYFEYSYPILEEDKIENLKLSQPPFSVSEGSEKVNEILFNKDSPPVPGVRIEDFVLPPRQLLPTLIPTLNNPPYPISEHPSQITQDRNLNSNFKETDNKDAEEMVDNNKKATMSVFDQAHIQTTKPNTITTLQPLITRKRIGVEKDEPVPDDASLSNLSKGEIQDILLDLLAISNDPEKLGETLEYFKKSRMSSTNKKGLPAENTTDVTPIEISKATTSTTTETIIQNDDVVNPSLEDGEMKYPTMDEILAMQREQQKIQLLQYNQIKLELKRQKMLQELNSLKSLDSLGTSEFSLDGISQTFNNDVKEETKPPREENSNNSSNQSFKDESDQSHDMNKHDDMKLVTFHDISIPPINESPLPAANDKPVLSYINNKPVIETKEPTVEYDDRIDDHFPYFTAPENVNSETKTDLPENNSMLKFNSENPFKLDTEEEAIRYPLLNQMGIQTPDQLLEALHSGLLSLKSGNLTKEFTSTDNSIPIATQPLNNEDSSANIPNLTQDYNSYIYDDYDATYYSDNYDEYRNDYKNEDDSRIHSQSVDTPEVQKELNNEFIKNDKHNTHSNTDSESEDYFSNLMNLFLANEPVPNISNIQTLPNEPGALERFINTQKGVSPNAQIIAFQDPDNPDRIIAFQTIANGSSDNTVFHHRSSQLDEVADVSDSVNTVPINSAYDYPGIDEKLTSTNSPQISKLETSTNHYQNKNDAELSREELIRQLNMYRAQQILRKHKQPSSSQDINRKLHTSRDYFLPGDMMPSRRPVPLQYESDNPADYQYAQNINDFKFPNTFPVTTTKKPTILDYLTTKSFHGENHERFSIKESNSDLRHSNHPKVEQRPVYVPTTKSPNLSEQKSNSFKDLLTVPVITGDHVEFVTVNKSRMNYPKVVIVNTSPTEKPLLATTPMNSILSDDLSRPRSSEPYVDSTSLPTDHLDQLIRTLVGIDDSRSLNYVNRQTVPDLPKDSDHNPSNIENKRKSALLEDQYLFVKSADDRLADEIVISQDLGDVNSENVLKVLESSIPSKYFTSDEKSQILASDLPIPLSINASQAEVFGKDINGNYVGEEKLLNLLESFYRSKSQDRKKKSMELFDTTEQIQTESDNFIPTETAEENYKDNFYYVDNISESIYYDDENSTNIYNSTNYEFASNGLEYTYDDLQNTSIKSEQDYSNHSQPISITKSLDDDKTIAEQKSNSNESYSELISDDSAYDVETFDQDISDGHAAVLEGNSQLIDDKIDIINITELNSEQQMDLFTDSPIMYTSTPHNEAETEDSNLFHSKDYESPLENGINENTFDLLSDYDGELNATSESSVDNVNENELHNLIGIDNEPEKQYNEIITDNNEVVTGHSHLVDSKIQDNGGHESEIFNIKQNSSLSDIDDLENVIKESSKPVPISIEIRELFRLLEESYLERNPRRKRSATSMRSGYIARERPFRYSKQFRYPPTVPSANRNVNRRMTHRKINDYSRPYLNANYDQVSSQFHHPIDNIYQNTQNYKSHLHLKEEPVTVYITTEDFEQKKTSGFESRALDLNPNSPVYTFVLKQGESLHDLLQKVFTKLIEEDKVQKVKHSGVSTVMNEQSAATTERQFTVSKNRPTLSGEKLSRYYNEDSVHTTTELTIAKIESDDKMGQDNATSTATSVDNVYSNDILQTFNSTVVNKEKVLASETISTTTVGFRYTTKKPFTSSTTESAAEKIKSTKSNTIYPQFLTPSTQATDKPKITKEEFLELYEGLYLTTEKPEINKSLSAETYQLFPVITRPMNKLNTTLKDDTKSIMPQYSIVLDKEFETNESAEDYENSFEITTEEITTPSSIEVEEMDSKFQNNTLTICSLGEKQCRNGLQCVSNISFCNMVADCEDGSDEEGCSCADILKAQNLERKICDEVIDCWDKSDEDNCDWCKPGQFICSGSPKCIEESEVCDGYADCPKGDDEVNCVTIAPDEDAARGLTYYDEGYLMVRRKGQWGKLCMENFDSVFSKEDKSAYSLNKNIDNAVDSHWNIDRLGDSICKTLSYRSAREVQQMSDPQMSLLSRLVTKNYSPSKYFEISIENTDEDSKSRKRRDLSDDSSTLQESLALKDDSFEFEVVQIRHKRSPGSLADSLSNSDFIIPMRGGSVRSSFVDGRSAAIGVPLRPTINQSPSLNAGEKVKHGINSAYGYLSFPASSSPFRYTTKKPPLNTEHSSSTTFVVTEKNKLYNRTKLQEYAYLFNKENEKQTTSIYDLYQSSNNKHKIPSPFKYITTKVPIKNKNNHKYIPIKIPPKATILKSHTEDKENSQPHATITDKIELSTVKKFKNEKLNLYEESLNELEESNFEMAMKFQPTKCLKRDVVKLSCSDLQCGVRPQALGGRASSPTDSTTYKRVPRIVGGSNSSPGSWPWQAALYKEGDYQCGASLINKDWLVSAGHCFYGSTDQHWVARLGGFRRGSALSSPYEQIRVISHIFIHPDYIDASYTNDVSLLKLDRPIQFTDYVRPVCLPPPEYKVETGRRCTLIGWGQLYEVGKIFPDSLQEVDVPLISTAECQRRTLFVPLYRITSRMFCAGYIRGGRDACLGDSGGPLMCQETDGRWILAGITSNGYGCARPNRPGVYTKVTAYNKWIEQIIALADNKEVVPMRETECEGYRCPLGACLSTERVCDGSPDCADGSDERGCRRGKSYSRENRPKKDKLVDS